MKANLKYYFSVFLRRLHWFLAVAVVIAGLAFGVAVMLPPAYVSQARFVVEASQIPNELAPPSATSGGIEQLQIIQQRLLARGNLLDMARRLTPFEDQASMSPDAIVSAMDNATTISMQGGGRTGGALQMMIQFQSPDSQMAASVANDYLTQVQRFDVDTRVGQAGQTLDFFQQEADRLSEELNTQSTRVLEFKNANADALPEGQTYRMNQQTLLQERLAQTQRDIAALADQRQRMTDLYERTGQIGSFGGDSRSAEQRELDELRSELNRALVVYAPGNPRIRVLQARIAQMEGVVSTQSANDPSAMPGATPFDLQMSEMDARAEQLEQQRTTIEGQLATLTDAIGRTAGNGIALSALERDYTNIQTQYNTAVSRLSQASTGERVELLSRGRRISVIEQPVAPSTPTKPNRVLIAGGGTVFGILAGLAMVVMLELLNRSPRRPEDLVKKLGIMPLATIPYMKTGPDVSSAKAMKAAKSATAAILLAALVAGAWGISRSVDQDQIASHVVSGRAVN